MVTSCVLSTVNPQCTMSGSADAPRMAGRGVGECALARVVGARGGVARAEGGVPMGADACAIKKDQEEPRCQLWRMMAISLYFQQLVICRKLGHSVL